MARTQRKKPKAPSGDVTITILHVSDMQFGRNHRFGRLGLGGADEPFDTLLKRLTDDLDKLRADEGLKPDLVALTGDLAERGLKKEYVDVYDFCVGLQEHLKLSRDRILVIPGNHDINRKLCESYFAEREGNEEKPIEPYWPKWKPYKDFFGKLYKDFERYEFKETAPYTWFELPELKVVVAGLNSTMRESHKEKDPKDPACIFGHFGYVGEAQLDWFKQKLEEAERKGWLRIGLVHHNAVRGATDDDENLHDVQLLKDRIGSKLNILLHGHTHNGSLGFLDRDLPVISTGSAAVKAEQRPEEVPNQYQIIQVRRDGFTTWAQQYTPTRRAWIADTRISKDGRDGFHKQPLDLPNTHGTFGKGVADSLQEPDPQKRHSEHGKRNDQRMWLDREREPNDLLAEVMDTCRVRDEQGRVQTKRVSADGLWGDYCRVTDSTRGSYLLGAHAGPLTTEVLELWVKDVHEPYRSRSNPGRASELVIASGDVFSEDVKAQAGRAGVQLHRRVDYERIIDTDRWKQLQLARLDGDREYRSDLYIEQQATLWSPLDDAKTTIYPAADHIVDMLCGEEGCFTLVLGAAGTGKTFLLREVARRMTERQSVVTPIIVELRGLDRAEDVAELVASQFYRCTPRMTLPAPAFERDLREGRIALLFDGFDELANRVRSAAIPEHFGRILGAARDRARVLVTSRAEHFVSHSNAIEVLLSRASVSKVGLAGQLLAHPQRRLVVTKQFTRQQIEEYLGRKRGSPEAGRRRMERFRQVHDLPGLAATPRMLAFLVDLTDEQLDAAAERGNAITPAELYRIVIVDHWLAQQEQRLNPPGSPPGPTRDALLESVKKLALHLWRSTTKAIAATDLDASTGEQLRRLCDDDSDVARQTLQSRTLLVHGEDGRLTFVHQTVMEWLVGQELTARIKANNADADLDAGRLSDFLIDVLRDLLSEDALAAWANGVLNGTPGNRLAENARLTLARMGRQAERKKADLRGQDLRGQSLASLDLRGALLDDADLRELDLVGRDLTGASLQRANLAHADLRGAILTDANVEGADLSFAQLDRADVSCVRWSKAVLLATRAIGTKGSVERALARWGESAALSADSSSLRPFTVVSPCQTVAFGPDGRLIATGHIDGLVRIWDAEHLKLQHVMVGHTNGVESVSFSPDGTRLASGSADKTVRLWDVATGKPLRDIKGHSKLVHSVAFSPDGTRLASGSFDRRVRLWDVATGTQLRAFKGHAEGVLSVSFSPDGTRLASASFDRRVRLWNVATGTLLQSFDGHTNGVLSVSFSPDGARLASGSEDKTVRLWDIATGKHLRSFDGHDRSVQSVSFSPDGTCLASASWDTTVRLWDVATGTLLHSLEGHTAPIQSVSFSPDGTRLASGSVANTVCLWDVATGKSLRSSDGRPESVQSVSFSPDGNHLASGSWDTSARLWDVATGTPLRSFDGHAGSVQSVSFSPDGNHLASGSLDKTVRLWDVATGAPLRSFDGHTEGILSLSFSPDGTRLASGSEAKTVCLWDVATGTPLHSLEGHTAPIQSVSFSPDGTRLASGSLDKTLRLWDAATGKLLRSFDGHTEGILSLSFSPDGTRLASGSFENAVRLWDVATGRLLRSFDGHTNVVQSVSFSPDGKCLASGSWDHTVRLWDVATGKTFFVLYGHQGEVLAVAWRADGRFLVSSGSDGTLRVWDASNGACLAVYVGTPNGSVVYRPSDNRYRTHGDPAGRVAYSIGLARYELGELDEFVEGGLRLRDDEQLVPI